MNIRVAIIDAIDFCRFQNHISANLTRAQRRGRVGGKVGVTGARSKNHNAPQFKMPNGAAKNKRLGNIFHFNGCLHARLDAHLIERGA